MLKTIVLEKYPVFTMEINRDETGCKSVDAIIDYFKEKIEMDPIAAYIGVFDHYAHTSSLPEGEIAPFIKDAKNIIFCFGPKLPDPKMLAVRPRSIGVAETDEGFVITLLEAPMPAINDKMELWVKALLTKES
jgi:hypothetical protein